MAAISADRLTVIYDAGSAPRHTVYQVRQFNSGDTVDLSNRFAIVDVGTFIASGSTAVGSVAQTTTPSAVALTLAGSSAVTGFLIVRGPSSTGVVAA